MRRPPFSVPRVRRDEAASRSATGAHAPRRPAEDGSISLLAAVGMLALLAAGALAVDTGRATFVSRELQSDADLAALDGVRALGDRRDPAQDPAAAATALAEDSLARNAGFVEQTAQVPGLAVEVGRWDFADQTFTAGTTGPNAVRVATDVPIEHLLMPGEQRVSQAAIAALDSLGGVGIGSTLVSAEYDPPQVSVLDHSLTAFLGGPIDLDAVGYRGLANASVPLGPLAAELGLGGVDQLLDSEVTVPNLLHATAAALSRTGDAADAAAVTPVTTIATSIDSTTSVRLGELLAVSSGDRDSAATAELNVLDLVVGAGELANGSNLADIELDVSLPDVGTATATLSLIEPPQYAVGPARREPDGSWATSVHTAQGRFQLDLRLPDAISIPTAFGTVTADLTLPVYVELGRADADLTDIVCARDHRAATQTVHGTTTGVGAWIGQADPAQLEAGATAAVPGLSGGALRIEQATLVDAPDLVRVTGTASSTAGGADRTLRFDGPFDHDNVKRLSGGWPDATYTSDLTARLADALSLRVETFAGLGAIDPTVVAEDVEAQVASHVREVTSELDLDVVRRLVRGLDFSVADADVSAFHLDCTPRRLVR